MLRTQRKKRAVKRRAWLVAAALAQAAAFAGQPACVRADARWITAGEGASGSLTSIPPGFPPISLEIEKPRGN
jgi:hypothetical protein